MENPDYPLVVPPNWEFLFELLASSPHLLTILHSPGTLIPEEVTKSNLFLSLHLDAMATEIGLRFEELSDEALTGDSQEVA